MSVNITLDDTSPVINWGPGWRMGTLDTDSFTPNYYKESFRCTPDEGTTGSLSFRGSGVWIYGAKRNNHGMFEMELDGVREVANGYQQANLAQVVLFGKGGLDPGVEHAVKFTNRPSLNKGNTTELPWFDIDFIVVETKLGEEGALTATTRVDDASDRFKYSGSTISTSFEATPDYYAETGHLSTVIGDTIKFDFVGQSLGVYGGVNYNHGDYIVTLDDGPEQLFNGKYAYLAGGTMLYMATGLENKTHTLQIKNMGVGADNCFDIDYVEYNYTVADANTPVSVAAISSSLTSASQTSSRTGTATGTNSPSASIVMAAPTSSGSASTPPNFSPAVTSSKANEITATAEPISGPADTSEKSGTSPGLIAGGAIGGAVALILLGIILFLLKKKRREDKQEERYGERPIIDLNSDDQDKYQYGNGVSPYSDGGGNSPWDSVSQTMSQRGYSGSPYLTHIPPAPPSQNPSFYPYSVEPSSENGRSPFDDEQNEYMNSAGTRSNGAYGGIHQTSTSSGSIGEIGQATLVPADQIYQGRSGRSLFPPGPGGNQPPEAIFGSEFSYGPPPTGAVVGSPQTRAVTALRNKGNMYSAALPATSVAPSSAVSPDDLNQRTRILGRAVDAGPIPLSPSTVGGSHELPPNYFQATEPLPSQVTPPSRRANMI